MISSLLECFYCGLWVGKIEVQRFIAYTTFPNLLFMDQVDVHTKQIRRCFANVERERFDIRYDL